MCLPPHACLQVSKWQVQQGVLETTLEQRETGLAALLARAEAAESAAGAAETALLAARSELAAVQRDKRVVGIAAWTLLAGLVLVGSSAAAAAHHV